MANTDRNNPTNNENIDLVSEVGGRCPMPGCNAELMQEKNNRTIKNYEIAHIYPHSPTTIEQNILNGVPLLYKNSPDEKENLIALCVSCHSRFDNTRTKDEYMELYNKKLQVLKNNEITNILNNHKLQDEIESVIKAIVNITSIATENDLNYDPVTIDKKLKSVLLINKVR
ncbi:MAG: HNH endonuclease signature motif containing protein, partial [Acholeplasmataceae bacterium]